jgi:hypothetical protein
MKLQLTAYNHELTLDHNAITGCWTAKVLCHGERVSVALLVSEAAAWKWIGEQVTKLGEDDAKDFNGDEHE